MRVIRNLALIAGLTSGILGSLHAGEPAEPVGPKLPDRVRGLLVQEMNAIQGASEEILDALVRGRDEVVAEKAQAIHDSFILKQEMTESDREAPMEAVPKEFVERDRAFHELTGELAAAGREGDGARQRQLFGEMIEACTACHTRYAHDRFPGFER
jgi:cytochrome c556